MGKVDDMTQRIRIISMRLYRFQSHVDTTITFDNTLNAFTGPTDSGKSAIIRALYWVIYNRPVRGVDEYVTAGADHVFVSATLSNGLTITRGRKAGENYYVLEDAEGESTTYKGFGMSVPPDIMNAHRMPLVDFDENGESISLNITQQLDSIFILKDSPSRRAKILGKISGADRADGALDVSKGWLKTARISRKNNLARRADVRDKIAGYSYLNDAVTMIDRMNIMIDEGEIIEQQASKLAELLSGILILTLDAAKTSSIMLAAAGNLEVNGLLDDVDAAVLDLHNLSSCYNTTTRLTKEVVDNKRIYECHKQFVDINRKLTKLNKFSDTHERVVDVISNVNDLKVEINKICILSCASIDMKMREVEYSLTEINNLVTRREQIDNLYQSTKLSTSMVSSNYITLTTLQGNFLETINAAATLLNEYTICPVCETILTPPQNERMHDHE